MKNMKFLLKLLSTTTIVVGSVVSVIACNNGKTEVNNLNKVQNLTIELQAADTTKRYSDLNGVIKAAPEFKIEDKTFTAEPTIKYYDAAAEGKEITDTSQKQGLFWVVVTAADSDETWTGSTGLISLELVPAESKLKKYLSDKTFQKVTLTVNTGQKYSDIDTIALANNPVLEGANLAGSYKVNYFADMQGTNEIKQDETVPNADKTIWIKVTAALEDENWTGTSQISEMTLKVNFAKTDLSKVEKLTVTLNLDTTKKYSNLNDVIKAAPEFKIGDKTFTKEPTIKYYDAAAEGKEITDTSQKQGSFWAVVTAAADDDNWTGSTGRISLELVPVNQSDLSKVEKLTVTLNLDTTKNYSNLNDVIKAAPEFKIGDKTFTKEPTIKYYDAAAEGKEITDTIQQQGPFWVVVTAAADDDNWTGSTKLLELNFNEVEVSISFYN